MDEETYQDLSGRFETNNYFTIEEFPEEKRPVVTAYLLGALNAGEKLRIEYDGQTHLIEDTQTGFFDEERGTSIEIMNITNMLHDGAKVRFIE